MIFTKTSALNHLHSILLIFELGRQDPSEHKLDVISESSFASIGRLAWEDDNGLSCMPSRGYEHGHGSS
jgi:hypothetical protein